MAPKKPSAVSGLKRGLGTARTEMDREAEAAAIIEGSTPAQQRAA